MKKSIFFPVFGLVFLSFIIPAAITGCSPTSYEPISDTFDDPDQGFMTGEMAATIFNCRFNNNTVTITQFKDPEVLKRYLQGKGLNGVAAADSSTLFISTINKVPVTKIDAGAFSPTAGAADISRVVNKLRLADTVTTINKTAFDGIGDKNFSLEIPRSVYNNLDSQTQAAIEAAVTVTLPPLNPEPTEPVPPGTEDKVINIANIEGVAAPVIGEVPGAEITETKQYTGTVFWSPDPTVFAANTEYSATIYLTPKAGYTLTGVPENFFQVEGAVTTNNADSDTVTAVFPKTPIIVDSLAALNEAIKKIEQRDVIKLSSSFYAEVNFHGQPVVIHGAAENNTVPYTIQGLGAEPTDPALTVGVLIANDNITLKDVKINIDNTNHAVDNSSISNNYYSAITIARVKNNTPEFLNGEDLVSKNVTVDKCDITFGGTETGKFTAGIYVAYAVNKDAAPFVPNKVVIINSSVKVTGYDKQAVQALKIPPTVTVTNNKLTAKGGNGYITAPASAIFITEVIASSTAQEIAPMTGNTLHGDTFDFWIATSILKPDNMSAADQDSINNLNGTGTGGPINMAALGFGTGNPGKVWAVNSSGNTANNYSKLLHTLKSQCDETTGRVGYGRIFVAMYFTKNNTNYADGIEEKYEIKNGQITAVDYWGYGETTDQNGAYYNTGQSAIYGRIANGKAVKADYHDNRDNGLEQGKGPYGTNP
ncbi:MAG: hypothetical protein LBT93_00975 [Treponema sp.]|jgi:hypothetical protein|nr:hypothetical protein [Treponema sp.]